MNLSESHVEALYNDDVVKDDNGNTLYEVVDKILFDNDNEEGYSDWKYVIKETSTGKFYKGFITEPFWKYTQENEWKQVFPHREVVIVYKDSAPCLDEY